jgi:hypothetical protein
MGPELLGELLNDEEDDSQDYPIPFHSQFIDASQSSAKWDGSKARV